MTQAMASKMEWETVWAAARERLRRELGEAVFDAWISPLVLLSFDRDEILLGAPKPFHRNWVANQYMSRIERALRAEGGDPAALSIAVNAPSPAIGARIAKEPQPEAAREPATVSYLGDAMPGERAEARRGLSHRIVNPSQSFESFVTGPANDFGYRAARALAAGEAEDLSLLYIHGGFGYGKSHLLNGIALEARKRGRRALFLGAEDFMRQFLGALNRKDTLNFKEELRAADILLIDDLQHLCRSTYTVAEFLHTLNAFADLHRKLVIACDRTPAMLENLTEDVRSRLTGGLVIALDKPDRATRLAILKARAAEYQRQRPDGALPEEVLERIADMEDASPRDLIGVFTKLATYADLTKQPVTMEVAEQTLGSRTAGTRKTSIEDIQRKTAEFYKLELRDFQSAGRARRIARPRQVAMYLARELTMRSLPEIGKRFGGRDHTTVLHACRRIAALCQESQEFKEEVEFLRTVLSRNA
ncbi:MAG TPA: chromosomal replication initiator protein DnaA [Rhizomicrobium sp.]|nr:chromosomal replication initiator protein DnaA [Rhizomicrobium sp.]